MNIVDWLNGFGTVQPIQATSEAPKNLKDMPFKYLGLYFTATWCSYCVKIADKMPTLLATVNKKGPLFRMLTFRLDQDNNNFGYYDLKFTSLTQEGASEIASWLQVSRIPTIIVYDYLGRLVTRNAYAQMSRYGEQTIEIWDKQMGLV